MKKGSVSQADYKVAAESTCAVVGKQGEKLATIARNLGRSADFSPCTIEEMRVVMSDMKDVLAVLKTMVDVSVQRGLTAIEEEKVRTLSDLETRRAKLLDGTLRLNRRVSDMAAE